MTDNGGAKYNDPRVVRGESIVLQLVPSDLVDEPPRGADFVGVLMSTSEGRSSYFAGERIDGEAYDRVTMDLGDRVRVWTKVADSGAEVTYRLTTANTFTTSRPMR
ncbi:hypothetical protein AB4Z18_02570 [Leifsonia sp. 2TAF2]|jgi:hypothetical protein|uniref:hypothetical protein n=1 Tax=Leifsonia sp. 2TAF2 TaxID=3233009 RepID=UPI003F9CFAB3